MPVVAHLQSRYTLAPPEEGYFAHVDGVAYVVASTLAEAKCALSKLLEGSRKLEIFASLPGGAIRHWKFNHALNQWIEKTN